MSLLAPLYFFGAFAIGLPILFHLIRRRPKGEVEFSSLMFLRPTPPRLTRKSRLDNWPLLLIRALALMLLAAAFARPFLRSVTQSDADLPSRRMVLMIDTSASMQRAGLWQQALDKAKDVIDDLQLADQLAIVTFDDTPRTLLGFEQAGRLSLPQRKSAATKLLAELSPSSKHTDIGRAMSFAADLAVTYEPDDAVNDGSEEPVESIAAPAHMILISDMQAGSQIESLQAYAWPKQLRLDVETVVAKEKTNAAAQILSADTETSAEDRDRVRVRIINSPDADKSQFRLGWAGDPSGSGDSPASAFQEMPVQVPPGESRVVRMSSPPPGVTSLVLSGDDASFDNVRYVVSPQPEALTLLHLGQPMAEPRDSLLYYLQRVPLSNSRRDVSVLSQIADELPTSPDPQTVPLVVTEGVYSSDVAQRLKQYVTGGGGLLHVLSSGERLADTAASLNGVLEQTGELQIEEAQVKDYAMFSRIDFGHPIFAPMADPQFNDFTKIRVWSHRRISGLDDSWKVVSYFDDDDPALIERSSGKGKIWILATGWQPEQSQLALSTKFIPFVFSLFDSSGGEGSGDSYTIGQPIDLDPSPNTKIIDPAGSAFRYRNRADLEAIDQPGIYRLDDDAGSRTFAVNIAESESRTEALPDTELERFGVTLGRQLTTAEIDAQQRQLRDIELESRQRLWQWLLVAALSLLALETWLGGLLSRRRPQGIESGLES